MHVLNTIPVFTEVTIGRLTASLEWSLHARVRCTQCTAPWIGGCKVSMSLIGRSRMTIANIKTIKDKRGQVARYSQFLHIVEYLNAQIWRTNFKSWTLLEPCIKLTNLVVISLKFHVLQLSSSWLASSILSAETWGVEETKHRWAVHNIVYFPKSWPRSLNHSDYFQSEHSIGTCKRNDYVINDVTDKKYDVNVILWQIS